MKKEEIKLIGRRGLLQYKFWYMEFIKNYKNISPRNKNINYINYIYAYLGLFFFAESVINDILKLTHIDPRNYKNDYIRGKITLLFDIYGRGKKYSEYYEIISKIDKIKTIRNKIVHIYELEWKIIEANNEIGFEGNDYSKFFTKRHLEESFNITKQIIRFLENFVETTDLKNVGEEKGKSEIVEYIKNINLFIKKTNEENFK